MELEDEEWELCCNDGLVYKRKRRRFNAPPESSSVSEEKRLENLRKERKKQTLLKLKSKLEKEIGQWEHLSNTLRSLQISSSTQLQQQKQQQERDETPSLPSTSSSTQSSFLDDLIFQVEAQETIISDISNLCDVAEAICLKQEQSLFELPIWSTPLELMQELSFDD
ncbi:uncharacterized protein LOC131647196 [Vicia villosa]|uniref:uncharacterized protein LOC131647196 n=1 Tax=Vicia villosa TaxID=3911 RepID=UPI00273CDA5C|nr:uncharacterized protein LOC131647196 [Vicia villosa]